jgi:hypothetical protein
MAAFAEAGKHLCGYNIADYSNKLVFWKLWAEITTFMH